MSGIRPKERQLILTDYKGEEGNLGLVSYERALKLVQRYKLSDKLKSAVWFDCSSNHKHYLSIK